MLLLLKNLLFWAYYFQNILFFTVDLLRKNLFRTKQKHLFIKMWRKFSYIIVYNNIIYPFGTGFSCITVYYVFDILYMLTAIEALCPQPPFKPQIAFSACQKSRDRIDLRPREEKGIVLSLRSQRAFSTIAFIRSSLHEIHTLCPYSFQG